MAAVDPYAPCPCGSGEKFKWCCHKVEADAVRAQRLLEGGQPEAALQALDEGLRKAPDNPWLANRKAIILVRQRKPAEAREVLERVVAKNPGNVGSQNLLARVLMEVEGPAAAAAQLQRALTVVGPAQRQGLAITAQMLSTLLNEVGNIPAALAHLNLAMQLEQGEAEPMVAQLMKAIQSNPESSPWLRNPYRLMPAPEGMHGEHRQRFEQAMGWAEEGLWASAAAAFETLSADLLPEADRNLGLCRLWMGEDGAASVAFERYVAKVGVTDDAVDIEALRQLTVPPNDDDLVDLVQWIWPVRDRETLLTALRNADRVFDAGRDVIDENDPNSFEVDTFDLLDRPKPEGSVIPENLADLPHVVGRVLVAQEIVMLEAFDDGRLDALAARLTELAGASIAPAHPKTKELGKIFRTSLALRSEWWLPEGAPREASEAISRQEQARIVREVWPETPLPVLRGRTPLQASEAGDALVSLRAAVCQLEFSHEFNRVDVDFNALRSRLGIEPEPEIDPATVNVETLHIARLHRVPADRLDDQRLLELYERSRDFVLPQAMENTARAIVDRPSLIDLPNIGRVAPYADLATLAQGRGDSKEAFEWVAKGREADPAARTSNAVQWDLLEIRLRSRTEPPEVWVPQLAVVLERYREDRSASLTIMSALLDLGLVRMVPHPDTPGEMLIDTRMLQAVLAEYGPRVTTASGDLGVSASKGGIWTPGAPGGGSSQGGIWTPGGTSTGDQGDKPKLIVPGH